MKKIDFHIHTISTDRDADFDFSLESLRMYVEECGLDAIAITNHDVFDTEQFRSIEKELDIPVFPGIEVSLNCGHLLIISERSNIDEFQERADIIAGQITSSDETLSIADFKDIFTNLSNYLIIPHYKKKPSISNNLIMEISDTIIAGEVDSPKKFIRACKDIDKLTPVLFSDTRIEDEMSSYSTRQTFVDCGELTLNAIKACFQDKGKVALSSADGNKLFQVFDDGLQISTGLNVLLGERSTGKTYTLNRIHDENSRVKYIRQFELVQSDEGGSAREFDNELQRQRSRFEEDYLSGFKTVVDDVINVDLRANDVSVDRYLDTLLKSAIDADRKDSFSKTVLFDESEFQKSESTGLKQLIESVRHIIENVEHRDILSRYIDLNLMKKLVMELIELLWEKATERKKMSLVNTIIRDVGENLQLRTSAVSIEDVDLYRVSIDQKKVDRFLEIVKYLQQKSTISEESIRGFSVITEKEPFSGSLELKRSIKTKVALSESFTVYGAPYDYLQKLKATEGLAPSVIYKLFVKLSNKILNKDGYEVSGGERSEFRLLQKIKDAQNYDILLIDEPESSFDNLFLKSDVNQIIKEISSSMPVVLVTHNNTVGASIGADYVLYASKHYDNEEVKYRLYTGYPTDKKLTDVEGSEISNHKIIMNSLEAGKETYSERREGYEAIKD